MAAGSMVDLGSNPTTLIEIVEIGQQLLITRGALTTFSIANGVARVLRHHPGHVHLAHTTAPGSRYAKRYEEGLELVWRGSTLDRFLGAVPDAAVQVVPLGEA